MSRLSILRAGPSVSVQDQGRTGALGAGVAASGPMDRAAFALAGRLAGAQSQSGLECGMGGFDFSYTGTPLRIGCAGGAFVLTINGRSRPWPGQYVLRGDDLVTVRPGPAGVYGYVRFAAEIDVPVLMGSRATDLTVGLGGLSGRALATGDVLPLVPEAEGGKALSARQIGADPAGPASPLRIRFIWGLHAYLFGRTMRAAFLEAEHQIGRRLNRMGITLLPPPHLFDGLNGLSLVSDPVVSGDIQILGDGTPMILMRDHQPTGGYPRIGTVISADFDLLAQARPGTRLHFDPVTVDRAQALLESQTP